MNLRRVAFKLPGKKGGGGQYRCPGKAMDDGIPMRMTPNYSASLHWMFCEIQYIRCSFPCNVSIQYLYNGV